ncbi:MAG: cysteine desulfurase family protein [Actinomycetes bacterium]
MTSRLVYLDHAATTPMRPEAVEAMLPFMTEVFANPSGSHRFARQARKSIDEARDVIADAIGCKPGEIVFTGCGTESDNTAITGVIRRTPGVAVCSATEHHAVLHCVEHANGVVVGVNELGTVDLEALQAALSSEVSSVSVMAVNNETGAITDMAAVSKIVRRYAPQAMLHTDAVQAVCWIDLRTIWPLVDTMALSAHKFGGPKGVGILVVREGKYFEPIVLGGGQERDRRSGTHNVGGIVSAAEALRITDVERGNEVARISALRDKLFAGLLAIDGSHRTIPVDSSVPGIAHICLQGIESESLLYLLDEADVCASAASACASGAMEPSHVLAAMGLTSDLTMGALRLSLGHTTTDGDIDRAIGAITDAVARIRAVQNRRSL